MKFLKRLLSRKFLLALLTILILVINAVNPDLNLSPDEIWAMILPVLAYIGVEGAADYKSRV